MKLGQRLGTGAGLPKGGDAVVVREGHSPEVERGSVSFLTHNNVGFAVLICKVCHRLPNPEEHYILFLELTESTDALPSSESRPTGT